MNKNITASIEEIIDELKNGKMVIMVDDEDRENEGDLIIPAAKADADAVNFMATHGRGLICLTLTADRVKKLNLPLMAQNNQARDATAFTISIESAEGVTTGISAQDRATTIASAIDPLKGQNDITSPGHVFPLVARDGGVLVRAGHTEASVDLARLAGFEPAGTICEIMNDDGTMARIPDLVDFSNKHNIKIGKIIANAWLKGITSVIKGTEISDIDPPNPDLAIPYSTIAGTTVKRKSKFNSIQQ